MLSFSSLALLALFVGHPDCISSGQFSLVPVPPFYDLPPPPETYFCPAGGGPSFVTYRRGGGRQGAGVGEEAYAKWRLYIERKCKEKFRMERRKKETERRKILYCKCNHTLQLARRVFKSLSVVNPANRCIATDHVKQ